MKTGIVIIGVALLALNLTGCKNEAEKQAEENVDRYTAYVDSVTSVESADAKTNWEAFQAGYEQRTAEVEASMANLKDRAKAEERLAASKAKYAEYKAKIEAEVMEEQKAAAPDRKGMLRTAFFGEKMGADMNFGWVNKDNILSVYQQFTQTYKTNKDSYTREDFDEIKTWYEALDARKNTVEKEGLSGPDNRKIAAIKIGFAPSFMWNRGGEKGEENADAKK